MTEVPLDGVRRKGQEGDETGPSGPAPWAEERQRGAMMVR
jgi:hypothetical protein